MKTPTFLITCVVAGVLLGACSEPKPINEEPRDVTNLEHSMLNRCLADLTAEWPANEKIMKTTIARTDARNVTIGINWAASMTAKDINKLVASGMKNQGYCEFHDGALVLKNWMANVQDEKNAQYYVADGNQRFK